MHVLRLRPGDPFELINGHGTLAQAELLEKKKETAEVILLTVTQAQPKIAKISLALALLRHKKLEWVLEKGTELGADRFLLFHAARSEKEELHAPQQERLKHITIAATKQSKRLFLPTIQYFSALEDLPLQENCYFGDTRPSAPPFTRISPGDLLFVTGPESGFTPKEVEYLETHRAAGVRLSNHILRAETAPIAAVAAIFCINNFA